MAGDGIRVDDPTTATPEVNVDLFDLTMISTLQGSDVFGVGDDSNANDRTRGVTVEDHTAHLVTGNNGLGVDTGGNGVLEFALTELSGLTAMASGDSFLVWDTSDSDAKRITRTNLAASMDGPGLIASSGKPRSERRRSDPDHHASGDRPRSRHGQFPCQRCDAGDHVRQTSGASSQTGSASPQTPTGS